MPLKERITAIVAWVMKLKPVRVFMNYNEKRGPILSQGLSYQAIFAVFAAIWVGFAIAGSVVRSNPDLQDALLSLLATNLPGLISHDGADGALDIDALLSSTILGWTGAIAAVGLFFTALGWLASGRDAVRVLFSLPGASTNFLLLKLKDIGLAIGFALAIIISAVLSVLSNAAIGLLLDLVGIDSRSKFALVATRAVGILLVFVLDAVVLGLFYRVVSGIPIPFKILAQGTIIAAAALGVLKVLGQALLGGATSNPLLAGFAVIIGLLIWFNLICQVILIGASWIAVSADDRGLDLSGRKKIGRKVKDTPTGVGAAL